MVTKGASAVDMRLRPAPDDYPFDSVALAFGLTEARFVEYVTLRVGPAPMNFDRMRTMTKDRVTTEGATGLFTPIHARRGESVNLTDWLIVWPTSAERKREQETNESMDKSDSWNAVDMYGYAINHLVRLGGKANYGKTNCGSDIRANVSEAVKEAMKAVLMYWEGMNAEAATAGKRKTATGCVGNDRSRTGTSCGISCAASLRAQGAPSSRRPRSTSTTRATPTKGGGGLVRMRGSTLRRSKSRAWES